MPTHHIPAPLQLIGVVSNLWLQIVNHLDGRQLHIRDKTYVGVPMLVPASPVTSGNIAVVVIQDSTFQRRGDEGKVSLINTTLKCGIHRFITALSSSQLDSGLLGRMRSYTRISVILFMSSTENAQSRGC